VEARWADLRVASKQRNGAWAELAGSRWRGEGEQNRHQIQVLVGGRVRRGVCAKPLNVTAGRVKAKSHIPPAVSSVRTANLECVGLVEQALQAKLVGVLEDKVGDLV
jgi:hypothetical protein